MGAGTACAWERAEERHEEREESLWEQHVTRFYFEFWLWLPAGRGGGPQPEEPLSHQHAGQGDAIDDAFGGLEEARAVEERYGTVGVWGSGRGCSRVGVRASVVASSAGARTCCQQQRPS